MDADTSGYRMKPILLLCFCSNYLGYGMDADTSGYRMKPILLLCFLLCACCYCSGHVRTGGSQTFCKSESVVEGQAASISCHFPYDVAAYRHTVNVLRYDFEGPSFVPELVLKCLWRQGFDYTHCTTSDGFDFDGQLSDTVTVRIRNTTRRHAGIYKCDYSAAGPEDLRECRLHVKGTKISCTSYPAYKGEPTSVTCHFNSNLRVTKDNFFVYRTDGKSQREDVLTCNWVGTDRETPYCKSSNGYSFNNTISSDVTIYLPFASQSQTGRYYCDTVPSEYKFVSVEHCDVDVRVRTTISRVRTKSTTARPLADRQQSTTTTTARPARTRSTSVPIQAHRQSTSNGASSDAVRAFADPLLTTTLVVGTIFCSRISKGPNVLGC